MTEKQFQAKVIALAKKTGWLIYHTYDSRRSEAGYPDLTLVRDRVIFAELKTRTGKLSPDQTVWIDRLKKAGAEVYVWRPSQLNEIVKTLTTRL